MRRLALLLPLLLAARFATFTVEPYGAQRLNLETGVTTLPQGGVLVDNANGLRLEGRYIEYKEGVFVRARGLRLLSKEETFQAEGLDHDIGKQVARFTGLVFSNRDFKNVRAKQGVAYFSEDVVVLRGGVQAETPSLEAETLVLNLKTREGLVLGRFVYREGKAVLKGKGSKARLYLVKREKLYATTKVPEAALALARYAR